MVVITLLFSCLAEVVTFKEQCNLKFYTNNVLFEMLLFLDLNLDK